jgi:hypothetical protein
MSRWISLLGALTLLAVSHASVIWQEGPDPMPMPPVRAHALHMANEGPDPMPMPPLRVQ